MTRVTWFIFLFLFAIGTAAERVMAFDRKKKTSLKIEYTIFYIRYVYVIYKNISPFEKRWENTFLFFFFFFRNKLMCIICWSGGRARGSENGPYAYRACSPFTFLLFFWLRAYYKWLPIKFSLITMQDFYYFKGWNKKWRTTNYWTNENVTEQ